jgi:nucleotide-binding universal stress UspA family protein
MVKAVTTFAGEHASRLSRLSLVGVQDAAEGGLSESHLQLLQRTRTAVEHVGVPCAVVERPACSALEICSLATELNVDVIVMGLQGLNPAQDMDSTALNVIQHSACPVLVVP